MAATVGLVPRSPLDKVEITVFIRVPLSKNVHTNAVRARTPGTVRKMNGPASILCQTLISADCFAPLRGARDGIGRYNPLFFHRATELLPARNIAEGGRRYMAWYETMMTWFFLCAPEHPESTSS
jgi:hypothetical protein